MPKLTRRNITLADTVHEKAKRESKKLFGYVNVSGFISHLIQNHKTKK